MLLHNLEKAKAIHPPSWLTDNTQYLCIMGSTAYAISSDSDLDIYGFCIPPKEMIFPHLAGVIPYFGTQIKPFEQWEQHHVKNPDGKAVEYDFAVYGIVKYFSFLMNNNPNMIDSIFVPRRCIIHSTMMSEYIRDHRKVFLHKGAWHTFKNYAYSQMTKIKGKVNSKNPKRAEQIKEFGFDLKFAYNIVRLLGEIEQIMVEGDLDLERNHEQLKAIRRGDWTFEELQKYATEKEHALETVYANSTLPAGPDEKAVKEILYHCLEMHYGNLSTVVARNPSMETMISELKAVINKYDG